VVGPLVKRAWWLLGRVLLVGAVLGLLFGHGPWLAPVMWVIFGYIFARALPGVRDDCGRVWAVLRLKGARRSSVRGGEF
jgi:carbon starvation protein CstA